MLAEHVQAAQLLLAYLRSHRHLGESFCGELLARWELAIIIYVFTLSDLVLSISSILYKINKFLFINKIQYN